MLRRLLGMGGGPGDAATGAADLVDVTDVADGDSAQGLILPNNESAADRLWKPGDPVSAAEQRAAQSPGRAAGSAAEVGRPKAGDSVWSPPSKAPSKTFGFAAKPAKKSMPDPNNDPLDLSEHGSLEGAILIPQSEGPHQVASALDQTVLDLPKAFLPPLGKTQLQQLKTQERPTLVIGRVHSDKAGEDKSEARYGAVVPKGFDPDREAPYSIRAITLPRGVPFEDAVRALSADLPDVQEVLVFAETEGPLGGQGINLNPPEKDEDLGRHVIESNVLDWFQDDYNIDFDRYSVQSLSADSDTWKATIQDGDARPVRLDTVKIATEDGWRSLPPTRNWRRTHPRAETRPIPAELQKQSADRGTMFVINIESGASSKPMGVFLPPGYDPDGDEKYPLVLFHPGAGNTIAQWTSCGQSAAHFNNMMQGDAQKMIVLIQDYKETANTGDMLKYAKEHFNVDTDRFGTGGISMGVGSAKTTATTADKHGYTIRSLSAHSGYPSGGGSLPEGIAVYADCTARESRAGSSASYIRQARDAGHDAVLQVFDAPDQHLKHDWASWDQFMENWIAFHQMALGGQPGEPHLTPGIEDKSEEELKKAASKPAKSTYTSPYSQTKKSDDRSSSGLGATLPEVRYGGGDDLGIYGALGFDSDPEDRIADDDDRLEWEADWNEWEDDIDW